MADATSNKIKKISLKPIDNTKYNVEVIFEPFVNDDGDLIQEEFKTTVDFKTANYETYKDNETDIHSGEVSLFSEIVSNEMSLGEYSNINLSV